MGAPRALLAAAVAHHRAGRLAQAKAIYERVLRAEPDNADALLLLGQLAHHAGHDDEAEAAFARAVAVAPGFAEAWIGLGQLRRARGKPGAAADCFRRAIALMPKVAGLRIDLGIALHQAGDPNAAIAEYRRAAALVPDTAPERVDAWRNTAIAHLDLGRHDEAEAAFHAVLRAKHGGRWWNASAFDGEAANHGNAPPPTATPGEGPRASTFKLRDASDQIDHLVAKGRIDPSFSAMAARYRAVGDEIARTHGPEASATLTGSQIARIGGFYDRVIHYPKLSRLAGRAVNPGLDFAAIEDGYLSSAVSVTTFDDLLAPEALRALRDFCLEATIFFGYSGARFVGADLAGGFNGGLLYQIAEELKARLPRVLGEHTLTNAWVYRCRNESPGVEAHTDQGAVTFNFWITPDAANLEPGRGGLLVYAKEQPYDWDWRAINTFKYRPETLARINDFLASAETVTIPYRENRAVLFHSNLFHKSDRVRFRDGFENRRMNVTMLFGRRPERRPN